jgi:hypothetical protein
MMGRGKAPTGGIPDVEFLDGLRQAGIGEAGVAEPLVSSAGQLRAVFGEALWVASQSGDREAVDAALEGKNMERQDRGRQTCLGRVPKRGAGQSARPLW